MRALIRPTLFMIARLGLFLVVVAWIAGQWWHAKASHPFGTTLLTEHGWCTMSLGPTIKLRLAAQAIENILPPNKLVNDWRFNRVVAAPVDLEGFLTSVYLRGSTMSELPGIVVIKTPFLGHWSVSFLHWLVVTIFALFNGVLMFIYRRRPEVKPCEA